MNIKVTNLHLNIVESDLQRLFTPFGEVRSITILRDKRNNRSRGKATIDMPVDKQAQNAIAVLHGTLMAGKPIAVSEDFI